MIVKGHGLRDESGIYLAGRRSGYGFCACGARSPRLESNTARRRWHDEHKAAIVFSRILHQ